VWQKANQEVSSLYLKRIQVKSQIESRSTSSEQKSTRIIVLATKFSLKSHLTHIFKLNFLKYVSDPVESPVLNWNATMISVNSCIVNVSCNGYVLTLSTSYHSNNCSQAQVTSSEMLTLTLHCIENIVVCNYSNPVSWKNDTIEINQLCTPHELNSSRLNNLHHL